MLLFYKEEEAAHLFFSSHKILLLRWESLSWINKVRVFPHNHSVALSSAFIL